jgi:predicted transcriptional regulator of viral defense system
MGVGARMAVGGRIAALAGSQHGVVSRAQLRALGVDRYALRRRIRAGHLHPLHGGRVYSVTRAPLTRRGVYLAAVMAAGDGTVLSHRAAADVWGIRQNATWVEVTVRTTARRIPDATVHRTRVLDPQDTTVREGIPVTSVARTLLDLAVVLRPGDLEVAIDRAERLRILDLNAVVEVLQRANGRKGAATLRRIVTSYESSTQKSRLETAFKELLKRAPDIPSPFFNALVDGQRRTNEVDAQWEREGLAVQVDGFEWHHTRRDREADARSDADLELAGYRVIRLTWDDVNVNGERTLKRLRVALAERGAVRRVS